MKREWIIGDPKDTFPVDREDVLAAMAEFEVLGNLVGGGFVLGPVRRLVEGQWITVAWAAQWHSFLPGVSSESEATADNALSEPESAPEDPVKPADAEVSD